ncbi:MAG: NIL domain-containing protein [Planctomycetota bacterium]
MVRIHLEKVSIMAMRRVYCTIRGNLLKEPIIYSLSKSFNVVPNIRAGSITEEVGLVYLELEGAEEEVQKAVAYLRALGVKVDEVVEH